MRPGSTQSPWAELVRDLPLVKLGYVGMTMEVCRAECKLDSQFLGGDDGIAHQSRGLG
jgi:hypothetical protein